MRIKQRQNISIDYQIGQRLFDFLVVLGVYHISTSPISILTFTAQHWRLEVEASPTNPRRH